MNNEERDELLIRLDERTATLVKSLVATALETPALNQDTVVSTI